MAQDWWKKFFGEDYLTVYRGMHMLDNTKQEVEFIIKNLKLSKKGRILDLCCGHGRHSIALAKKGYSVVGVDYSNYFLKLAKKYVADKNLNLSFVKKDVCKIDYREEFDVVLNLFTSFGLFSDRDNERVIKNVSKALRKGGKFFIDLNNEYYILRNYKTKDWQRGKNWEQLSERYFDPATSRNYDKRVVTINNKVRKHEDVIRFYTYTELKELLNKYNLRTKDVYGSYAGDKFTLDSKRMIIISEKI
ncbi:MAG: class I SAM-dependent methyltransferase [Patescibacteria group bacterium]